MTQRTLPYGGNPPHVAGSATSKAAGESVDRVSMRERVLNHIAWNTRYGCTDDELEQDLNMPHQSVSPRRRELVLAGKVEDSGRRRKTRSGRQATVWVTK